jgi:delta(3,5)-delta(2,4)-dienoyl-CoA isomerase
VLHGFSLGLAIDIACATDIRICASSTTFAVKEVDIGLAADIGTLSRLPKVVGSLSWVKDVTMTARFFGAEEALRVGLVSAVYGSKKEALEAAMRLGITLAGKSPVAVQSTKALVNYSVGRSVQEG